MTGTMSDFLCKHKTCRKNNQHSNTLDVCDEENFHHNNNHYSNVKIINSYLKYDNGHKTNLQQICQDFLPNRPYQ
jgi:hypothetical protein